MTEVAVARRHGMTQPGGERGRATGAEIAGTRHLERTIPSYRLTRGTDRCSNNTTVSRYNGLDPSKEVAYGPPISIWRVYQEGETR